MNSHGSYLKYTTLRNIRGPISRIRYGPNAPKVGERIWVNVNDCADATNIVFKGRDSGRVIASDWDRDIVPLSKIPKIAYSVKKWTTESTWEEVGAYDYMTRMISAHGRYDGCSTREDIFERYENLDRVYKIVKRDMRISPTTEYRKGGFGEVGGMIFHIGRDGTPLFGLAGHHRLAMAIALNLSNVPAVIGVVHPVGIETLPDLRHEPTSGSCQTNSN